MPTDFPGITMSSASLFSFRLAKSLLLTGGFRWCDGKEALLRGCLCPHPIPPHPLLPANSSQPWQCLCHRLGSAVCQSGWQHRCELVVISLRQQAENQYLISSRVSKAADHSDVKCLFLKIQCCLQEYFKSTQNSQLFVLFYWGRLKWEISHCLCRELLAESEKFNILSGEQATSGKLLFLKISSSELVSFFFVWLLSFFLHYILISSPLWKKK